MAEFRVIPSIERLRQRSAVRQLEAHFGADSTVEALRAAAAEVRGAIAAGDPDVETGEALVSRLEASAAARLRERFRPSLLPVINATGVIVHTNLGRAPLPEAAVERVRAIARGYCTLEYDLARGERGRREFHAEALLTRLTGADAALVVNNNAAATLLILAALARGREVIVSRGELVEIGGGFRIPEVLAQSGAVLREVGTTNRTRASDYAAAISERTAFLLRVHPSNFRVEGFAERPALGELVALGHKFAVAVVDDLGSGQLALDAGHPLAGVEPSVSASVAAGVDLCCFSGDKLLGGPQAGIIVGRAALVDRIRQHPLVRALRAGKMTYAALDATLTEYAAGRAGTTVPVQRMLSMSDEAIRRRAENLTRRLRTSAGWRVDIIEGVSAIGGGSAPGVELRTWLVSLELEGRTPDDLESRLRLLTPPIIARIERDRVVLDFRTVAPEQDDLVADLLRAVSD
jgi:L-seryl-tRNA(Ser) seleniumtransferase